MAKQVSMNHAVELIQSGFPVGMPTETVYGLAARIDQDQALKKIFNYKKRPLFDPLIVHIAEIEQAQKLAKNWDSATQILANKFWPGPLTLVIEKSNLVSDLISSGLTTVGIRWPGHKLAQQLILEAGIPLAAPSANRFGKTSPTKIEHVLTEFTDLPELGVLDGGPCQGGIESTIVKINETADPQKFQLSLLRKGLISSDQIESSLKSEGLDITWVQASGIQAPGQIKHHYMPAIPLIINRRRQKNSYSLSSEIEKRLLEMPTHIDEVELIRPRFPITRIKEINFSLDPELAARELYSELRRSSEDNQAQILLWQQPENLSGFLWDSILERLEKAASLILE